jgi:hypothetical protein
VRRHSIHHLLVAASLAALAIVLTACPATFPLSITRVSASGDPIVGKVVDLEVDIRSTSDEADVAILIQLPESVRLVDGDLSWHGLLLAGETYRHEVSLCVLYEGDWRIDVNAVSRFPEGDSYGDYQTMHFISSSDTGEAIPGSKYTIIQHIPTNLPTPSPVPTPATCS